MKMKIAFLIAFAVIAINAFLLFRDTRTTGTVPSNSNVVVENGTQIVTLTAKGGYAPRTSIIRSGLPTTLRVNTRGTFDCSSVLSIPAMNINTQLPPSGTTDIDLGVLQTGIVRGTCGMGMYEFTLDARSS